MKLTKQELKSIIKEELESVLSESNLLKTYSKSKEDEFRQHLTDMGKDPDAVMSSLNPDQLDIITHSLFGDYPKKYNSQTFEDILEEYGWKYGSSNTSRAKDEIMWTWYKGGDVPPYKSFQLHFWIKPLKYSSVELDSSESPFESDYVLTYWVNARDALKKDFLNKREHFLIPNMFNIDLTDKRIQESLKSFAFKREKDEFIAALEKLK